MSNLRNVYINEKETFGTLKFGDLVEEMTGYVNGRRAVTGRKYSLFSDKQRSDNVEVILPGSVKVKQFGFDTQVHLVNPKIDDIGQVVGGSGHHNYVMYADDLVKAGDN